MRQVTIVLLAFVAMPVVATLPPPTDEAKAKAAEAAARSAWSDKIAAYQLCVAQDRVAQEYRRGLQSANKPSVPAAAAATCTDPGPYVAQAASPGTKPLEAAGAHSPPATATSPPSTTVPAKDLGAPSSR